MIVDNETRKKYDRTEDECDECEEGTLWVNSFEVFCDECGIVQRTNDITEKDTRTEFRKFLDSQEDHTYENSGVVIMVGGFFRAYKGDGIYGSKV